MSETDAWCPYCDSLRRKDSSDRLLLTCGGQACARKAVTGAGQFYHWPRRTGEIDFQNGFASQNLIFAAPRLRHVP